MNLQYYAIACQAAYLNTIPADRPLLDRYDKVKQYHANGYSAFIAYNNDRTDFLVVHRGTDQLKDLWDALKLSMSNSGERIFDMMSPTIGQIDVDFPELFDEETHVEVTGHSWGGCLALVHAYMIDAAMCVTFGCPSLFKAKNIKLPKTEVIRVVNGRDGIPKIFPWRDHIGRLIHLNKPKRWYLKKQIEDHKMTNYVKVVREFGWDLGRADDTI